MTHRRVARIWKKGGFFERVRKVQTTVTRIFVVLESISHEKLGNQTFFQPKNRWSPKKKKVFTKIETEFSANIGNSNAFSYRITRSTSHLRHPIFFGGGCFQFFTKNRPQKHQKRAILHTSQANGGNSSPPRPPWLRY